jgi:hypothetical protein
MKCDQVWNICLDKDSTSKRWMGNEDKILENYITIPRDCLTNRLFLSFFFVRGVRRYLPWASYLLEKLRVASIVVRIAPCTWNKQEAKWQEGNIKEHKPLFVTFTQHIKQTRNGEVKCDCIWMFTSKITEQISVKSGTGNSHQKPLGEFYFGSYESNIALIFIKIKPNFWRIHAYFTLLS